MEITFDRVFLVLGFAAAALAAWFAYPAWKTYRAKPDLYFVIEKGPVTSGFVLIRLENRGNGGTPDWIAQWATDVGRLTPVRAEEVDGWSDRQTPPGWTATWLSSGPQDTIGPRLHREFMGVPSSNRPYHVTGTYSIRAGGMEERTGRFTISIEDEPPRRQTVEVT